MATASEIFKRIEKIEPGVLFGYEDLKLDKSEFSAAAKALQRLKNKGIIKSLSRGRFYKPVKSVFGELKPGGEEILKKIMFKEGKRIGYITGMGLYNQLRFTTQVSNIYRIAYFNRRISTKISTAKIKSAKSYVPVTENNYRCLQILDAIKDFNKILDMDRKGGLALLTDYIKKSDKNQLIRYSKKYPPRVRAFLGAILENIGYNKKELIDLKNTINPLSSFNYGYKIDLLIPIQNWNIK
ncbi:MAG: hypothetical protein JXN63_04495 [Candidatus Delongbacteria bacterium]|nr:hypothetical protein [Candidatus Delongbacteria bacterium]